MPPAKRAFFYASRRLARACYFALLYTLSLAPASAQQAKDNGITVFGGWRFGGSFEQDDPDAAPSANPAKTDAKLRDHGAASVALDIGLDARRQFELLISHQSSSIELAQSAAPHLTLPLKTTTVHMGGTYFFDDPNGQIGRGPYVVGGIGITYLAPGLDGFSSETRPSMNIGIGWMQPLGTHFALRLEARNYFTLLHGSGSLFCSGGCTLNISGDSLSQAEIMLGLTSRF